MFISTPNYNRNKQILILQNMTTEIKYFAEDGLSEQKKTKNTYKTMPTEYNTSYTNKEKTTA